MSINIQQAVKWKYPTIVYGKNFNVGVDASGTQHIMMWNFSLDNAEVPLPTDDDLAEWWKEYLQVEQEDLIAASYSDALAAGFQSTTLGKTFKFDLPTFAMISGEYSFLQANANDTPQPMLATDGTIVTPTRDQFFAFAGEGRTFLSSSKQKEWAKNKLISAVDVDVIPTVLWGCPTVPTGLSGTPGNGQVALTWTANPDTDLASYKVYCNGALVSAANSNSLTVTGLTNGAAYQFTVSAVDSQDGESAQCPPVTATPQAS